MRWPPLYLGIDLGTSGVRTVAATPAGAVLARASVALQAQNQGARREQDPKDWWDAVCLSTQRVMEALRHRDLTPSSLQAVAVDGTSGTLVCASESGAPLVPAIMYNDARAWEEAEALNQEGRSATRFSASFSLAKALWIRRRLPDVFEKTARLLHQADWVAGGLSGHYDASDYSNALKMGFDLESDRWPAWLPQEILERLPAVVAPGICTGRVTKRAARLTGLPRGLPVIAGATDGVAGCIASGLRAAGDYNTTLGTTLVFKAMSTRRPEDERLYSHKLPGGVWLPGGASNTGAAWIGAWFPGADPRELDRKAMRCLPSPHVAYPLIGRGERFPFKHAEAEGFVEPVATGAPLYAAGLQGTAFVERLGYEALRAATGVEGGDVYGAGGGSRSDVWMQCRADVNQRVYHRVACPEAAFGAAILAAAGAQQSALQDAMASMTKIERSFSPGEAIYSEAFEQFRLSMARRGYL